jgi:hypothetical protein
MTKKKNPSITTKEQFLKYKPKKRDFKWELNKKGLVEIIVPKFKGNFGKSFCRIIKKENFFTANLDRLGSLVWQECDGLKTVAEILEIIEKEFPDEKEIDQRLFLYLQQLESLSYINF